MSNICLYCGSEFTPKNRQSPGRYCSRTCILRHQNALRAKEPFDSKYQINAETGCWMWQRGLDSDGYGKHWHQGDTIRAHVFSFEQKYGLVPVGLTLDHKCRNRTCVNPDHVEPVTVAENTRRGLTPKLSIADVENIRRRYAAGGLTQAMLAAEYSVAASCIHKIVTGKSWMSDLQDQVLTFDNPLQWKKNAHGRTSQCA